MNPDLIRLLIAGGTGCMIGCMITTAVIGCLAEAKAARSAKEAWKAANLYYTRKNSER